jgi:hypothetical protein
VERKEKKKDGHFLLFDDIVGYFVENKKDVKKREKAVASLQGYFFSSEFFTGFLFCRLAI